MAGETELGDNKIPTLAWDVMELPAMQRCLALGAFGALFGLLVLVGYGLRDESEFLTVVWPASGLLFIALWASPPRNWAWLIAIQLLIQMAIYLAQADLVHWQWGLVFAAANALDAMVGAMLAKRLISAPSLPATRPVLLLLTAIAVGSAVGAVPGAYASIHTSVGTHFLRQWQLWWSGACLGSLLVVPVILSWAVRVRTPHLTARAPAGTEMGLTAAALLGMTYWTFSSPPGALSSIFQSPDLVLALAIAIAFRMPPRWATTFNSFSVLIATYYTSRHMGPYSIEPTVFARIEKVQLSSAALIVVNYILVMVLFDMRSTMLRLRRSDERFRNFVEMSSEAVWQVELTAPMPLGLERQATIEWLRRHAHVEECNLPYRELNRAVGVPDAEFRTWRADSPWSVVYLDHLESAAGRGYSVDGLQFSLGSAANRRTYLTGFTGVVEGNALVRIWGVARDITQLVELNESLKQNQARLQQYARQLTSAEERARRSAAVDLHDGIGQQLAGLALTLEAGFASAPPQVRIVLEQAARLLRDIHAKTQRIIADLSPPGLYELGLDAALKWLSVYMRGQDNLRIDLLVRVDDSAFDLELRILAFKLIRELLRNVVKHSGVEAAKVTVSMTADELFIDVADQGVGFEWQLSLFDSRGGGFGLWSIGERVREAGGELNVDTAPGHGCSVSITLPLKHGGTAHPRARQ